MGLYQRSNSNLWWSKLSKDGRPVYQSTGVPITAPGVDKATLRREAQRKHDAWAGDIARGTFLARQDQVTYDDLVELLVAHYERTGDRDLREVQKRLKPLAFFAGSKAVAVEGAVDRYIDKRHADGVGPATINRELGLLVKMFRLGRKKKLITAVIEIDKLKEPAPRSGFFEEGQVSVIRRHLSVDLQLAIDIDHAFGWRTQSEVLTRQIRHVDLEASTLRLDPGETKNADGRVVYLTPELRLALAAQIERVRELGRRLGRVIPHLFPHLGGPHISARLVGTRRKDFRKAWLAACVAAGQPGRLRHDFRRTAARDMVNRGVPERVAQQVTGHRTRSVFDRYHIVSPADLKSASERLAQEGR